MNSNYDSILENVLKQNMIVCRLGTLDSLIEKNNAFVVGLFSRKPLQAI